MSDQLAAYRERHKQKLAISQAHAPKLPVSGVACKSPQNLGMRGKAAGSVAAVPPVERKRPMAPPASGAERKRAAPSPKTESVAPPNSKPDPVASEVDVSWAGEGSDPNSIDWMPRVERDDSSGASTEPLTMEDETDCGIWLESSLCERFPNDAKRLESEAGNDTDVITMEAFSEADIRMGLVRVRFVPGHGARSQLQCYALATLYEHLTHQNADIVFNKFKYCQRDLDKITELYRQHVNAGAARLNYDAKLSTTEYTDRLSEQAAQSLAQEAGQAEALTLAQYGLRGSYLASRHDYLDELLSEEAIRQASWRREQRRQDAMMREVTDQVLLRYAQMKSLTG